MPSKAGSQTPPSWHFSQTQSCGGEHSLEGKWKEKFLGLPAPLEEGRVVPCLRTPSVSPSDAFKKNWHVRIHSLCSSTQQTLLKNSSFPKYMWGNEQCQLRNYTSHNSHGMLSGPRWPRCHTAVISLWGERKGLVSEDKGLRPRPSLRGPGQSSNEYKLRCALGPVGRNRFQVKLEIWVWYVRLHSTNMFDRNIPSRILMIKNPKAFQNFHTIDFSEEVYWWTFIVIAQLKLNFFIITIGVLLLRALQYSATEMKASPGNLTSDFCIGTKITYKTKV